MADLQNAYRIVGADLTEFEIQPDGENVFGPASSIDYDVSIEIVLGKEDKLLHYKTSVKAREKGASNVMATAQSVAVFQVFDLDRFVQVEEPDKLVVSQDLNISIGRVAIGLTRGFLAAKFKEIAFANIVLPMLPFEY
jgi:hypothetical protein